MARPGALFGFAFLVSLLAGSTMAANTTNVTYTGFIRASGQRFVDDNCKDFIPSGLNMWTVLEGIAGLVVTPGVPDIARYTFQLAQENQLNVVRMFAHGINDSFLLQPEPGRYNENAFKALDYAIYTAGLYNVKLILTLADNWKEGDSKITYEDWSDCQGADCFFTDRRAKELFKAHILKMVNRKNTYNNITYKDDPTIFAWDVMNEPRCECHPPYFPVPAGYPSCYPGCADNVGAWISEISTYLKSVDPNHMVTTGEEGFYAVYNPNAARYNPINGWADYSGQNFSAHHAYPSIDFATIHIWPDLWKEYSLDFVRNWLQIHVTDSRALNKPLLLEEFGKEVKVPVQEADLRNIRTPYFKFVYDFVINELRSGDSPLRGALFWKWSESPNNMMNDELDVALNDHTFQQVIAPSAKIMAGLAGTTAGSCSNTTSLCGTRACRQGTNDTISSNSTTNATSSSSSSTVATAGRKRLLWDTPLI